MQQKTGAELRDTDARGIAEGDRRHATRDDVPNVAAASPTPAPTASAICLRDGRKKRGIDGSIHGLRKACCRRLAEAGCSVHEIMAMSGHKSIKEVERYTKAVEQERMAGQAMART